MGCRARLKKHSNLSIKETSRTNAEICRRKWCNPEFVLFKCGLRLEHIDEIKVSYILDLVKHSLSERGWAKLRGAMKTNKFLGDICARQAILNEKSYL